MSRIRAGFAGRLMQRSGALFVSTALSLSICTHASADNTFVYAVQISAVVQASPP